MNRNLYEKIKSRSNSLNEVAGGYASTGSALGASVGQIVGNPLFKAEISLQVNVRYYAAGAPVVPAVGLQGRLPVYIFGQADFMGGYAKARQLVQGDGGYDYNKMQLVTVGKDLPGMFFGATFVPSGTVTNNLSRNGDVLILIPASTNTDGTGTIAEIQISCPNVGYSTLLASLSSDLITLNMIRYVVPTTATAQLGQQIQLIKQSLFGKTTTDTLDPQTFITPATFQNQISDIPITVNIDKNLLLATNIIYTSAVPINMQWTLTVSEVNKLTQA